LGGTCCFHRQIKRAFFYELAGGRNASIFREEVGYNLKRVAVLSSETSIPTCQNTQCNYAEDYNTNFFNAVKTSNLLSYHLIREV
jgi:hypothetical protein